MISDQQIQTFQKLWECRFGRKIDKKEAYGKGAKLLRLIELIYKPMTEKEYKQLQKRREENGTK